MKRTSKFLSKTFFLVAIGVISLLLVFNIIQFIFYQTLIGFIPIFIQSLLLALIVSRHEYAKIALIIFSALFFLLGSSLQLIGRLLQDVGYDFENFELLFYLKNIILIIVGIFITILANKTIKINKVPY